MSIFCWHFLIAPPPAEFCVDCSRVFALAVVLINQVTTKIEKGPSSSSFLAPALGETWAHACTSRVMLYWEHGQRFARLYKSPSRKTDTVAYSVLQEGVSSQIIDHHTDTVRLFHPAPFFCLHRYLFINNGTYMRR